MSAVTVSVMFTDLVGSTELLSRVGEARADELRREHFRLLRTAIANRGREVKNLGDGLMVVFDSVTAALECAVAMQQAMQYRNRGADEEFQLRIGLSSGEADVDEDDYFGLPVVEAARLCALADGAEVVASDMIRMLAGSRGMFDFESLGDLHLKGLDEPVGAWRLAWEPSAPARRLGVPLPSRVRAGGGPTFVGRDLELTALRDAMKEAERGERRLVLLAGEPGVGKTSLATTFAGNLIDDGAVILYGRCDEDLGIPYQPWAEAIEHLVRHLPTSVLEAHVSARRAELASLAPSLASRIEMPSRPSANGESERFLLFGAVVDILERVSVSSPIVVILDDLHWTDRPSMQLLRHVINADAGLRLLVIGTFRDSELGIDHPLAEVLASFHRETGVERLTMRGLDDRELLDLLETTAGHALDDDGIMLRNALLEETEGNPFFVGEILRHLAETGAIFQDERGQWATSGDLRSSGLPVSVREVVLRRVARLGDDTARALSTAAVIGSDFDLDLLARVLQVEQDDEHLVDLLEGAVRAAVIAETDVPGHFTFAHALIAHTLYGDQSTLRRTRTHRMIAEHLEDLCGDDPGDRIGELAYHWSRATQPQDTSKTLDYTQRAGDRALAQRAPDEAVRWYRAVLDHLDGEEQDQPRRRATVLVGLGEAQRQIGDPSHRETLLAAADLARRLGDAGLLTAAAIANNRGWHSITGSVDEDRIKVLHEALDMIGDVTTPERARLLATLSAELLFGATFDVRRVLAETAISVARSTGDDATLADALIRTHEPLATPETLPQRLVGMTEACTIADRLEDPVLRLMAYTYRHLCAIEAGDPEWIRRGLDVVVEEAEHIGQPTYRWVAAVETSAERALAGDLQASEELAAEALRLGLDAGQPDAAAAFGMQVLTLRWMQGRLAEMVPLIEQTMADSPGVVALRAGLALGKAESGDLTGAQAMLGAERESGFTRDRGSGWLATYASWALVACQTRDREAARVLLDTLLPWREQFISTHLTSYGPVAHPLATLLHLLGRHDEAQENFALALAMNERMRAPFFTAFTRQAWAELLADRSDAASIDRSRELAKTALAIALDGGYGNVERDARALLARTAQ